MSRPVPKSRRQYVLNSPALLIASKLPGAVAGPFPGFIEPALATLRDKPPAGDRWLHKIKFDGYRVQLHVRNGQVQALTRRGHDWSDRFGLSAAAELKTHGAIIDGEVVVLTPEGLTDFGALQADLGARRTGRLSFVAFDLLHLDGYDLRGAALIERKRVLAELLQDAPPRLRLSDHIEGEAAQVWRQACELQLEGIVSKRRDGRYQSGRTEEWSKATCRKRDTFLVVGIAFKQGKFDGIYLGRREDGKLAYAGKVEQGFTDESERDLRRRAEPLRRRGSPLSMPIKKPKATWVEPRIAVDVEYRALTGDRRVRHPSFKGIREDVKA